MQMIFYVVMGIIVVGVIAMFVISAMTPRPDNIGVTNGKLAPVPDSPNCVSTEATDDLHRIEPYMFSGSAEDAVRKLKSIVSAMAGSNIVSEDGSYLHAEFRSRIFRFVDDVEFLVTAEDGLVHFRSASRVGHSDLGVNRARMEAIRKQFQQ